jgi:hypothetical protein
VMGILLSMFLFVFENRLLQQADGQTVGKQLMDALQAGEGFVKQIEDGGITVIKDIGSFFGIRDVENNVDRARQELATGNTEAASTTITMVDETLQNNSARISGIAQHLTDIAQNQSIAMDQLTRGTLAEIGNALISVAQDTDGVYRSNSSSTSQ